jgi:hypothetical protein
MFPARINDRIRNDIASETYRSEGRHEVRDPSRTKECHQNRNNW